MQVKSVLISGPIGEDRFSDNIAYTLKQMGKKVIVDDNLNHKGYHSKFRNLYFEMRQRIDPKFIMPHELWLVRAARKYRPDLFLSPTQSIPDTILADIKAAGVSICVSWWGDSPGNMQRMGLFSDLWDIIFLKDPDAERKFRLVGLNAHLLHEAMNPAWHIPIKTQENQRVVVAGNFYGFRQALIRKLMKKGVAFELYGGKLPRWVYPEIKNQYKNKYIVREEKSRIFGQGMACLNSTQIIEGNSMNCRSFEISGAGGLQLMEWRPIIEECFEPGEEILTFQSFDELMDHIERARKFPREMVKIRGAAAKRAHAEHTYRHRLETIFSHVNKL